MFRRCIPLSFLSLLCLLGSFSGSALASTAAPGWQVMGAFSPSDLSPGSTGALDLWVYDVGGLSGSATVTDTLPAGLEATGGAGCEGKIVVTCAVGAEASGEPSETVIPVAVSSNPPTSPAPVDEVTVSGKGVLGVAHASIPASFSLVPAGFGVAAFDAWTSNEDGTLDTQAGSHPFDLTVAFIMDNIVNKEGEEVPSGGEPRAIDVKLPPGLVGDAQAVPRCTRAQFDANETGESDGGEVCPVDSVIGEDWSQALGLQGIVRAVVYNLVPPRGVAAEFGFDFLGDTPIFLDARVRSGGDYGITVHSNNIPQVKVRFNSTTIWGVPAASIHNEGRAGEGCHYGGCPSTAPLKPFLTLPTSCAGPQDYTIEALGTWQNESLRSTMSVPTHDSDDDPSGSTGCERMVHFEPSALIAPDTSFSDTPAGLTADVKMPLEVNPEELATSGLQNTTVTLPEGMVINPGQATGLVACQSSQENIGGAEAEAESEDGPASCPLASKVGTDEISSPLVADKLAGNVYILQSNPPNLQLLVTASGDGVNLKLVGNVHLNETTGQLTTTFEHTPDVPFTDFKLAFSGGAQAALATPTRCGTYEATADFTPWSTPFVVNDLSISNFQIAAGPNGTSCEWPMPFAPSMSAGSTTDQAGGYTNFSLLLTRGDGQQRIERLQFKTPEGLLGMIASVPLCQEPQAAKGECSQASQIGHTVAEAGPGPYPFVIPEPGAPPAPIYLTGPYQGAPFGLSIAVPVVAGPFDLGTEVVRAKIEVDPRTSQLTITTTPFPLTVKGIPTDIRAIDAVIDRPEFMFNPTSCEAMSFSGTAYSTESATAPLGSHFQMGSCRALTFKPNFSVSTTGKTSRVNGASLTAKIVYPTGDLGANQASSQSNIKSVKVDLPKQLPSRLTTLQKACPSATFEANPADCPADSLVGHATAITPVLPVKLTGPAYFVSHGGEEFPSLIVVLQGYGVTVDLVGSTFINSKTNITSSTFKQVPDVPIASFELVLPQGKYSALAANGNLCTGTLNMPTAFTGQNGAVIHQNTKITVTGCAKAKKTDKTTKTRNAKKAHNARRASHSHTPHRRNNR